jgi:hypothetical protein
LTLCSGPYLHPKQIEAILKRRDALTGRQRPAGRPAEGRHPLSD